MRRLRDLMAVSALASLTVLLACGAALLLTVRRAVIELPDRLERQIAVQAELTREAAVEEIDNTRTALLAELGRTRSDLLAELDRTRGEALTRIDRVVHLTESIAPQIIERADTRLAELHKSVEGELKQIRTMAIVPTAAAGQELMAQAAGTIAVVRPQALGLIAAAKVTAGETAKAMREVSRVAPGTATAVESTSQSIASIAKSWEKSTPLYVRFIGWIGKGFLAIKGIF